MSMDEGNVLLYYSCFIYFIFHDNLLLQINEYIKHPEVHENNRMIARKMQEFFKHRMGLTVEHAMHPIVKRPVSVYTISKINDAVFEHLND